MGPQPQLSKRVKIKLTLLLEFVKQTVNLSNGVCQTRTSGILLGSLTIALRIKIGRGLLRSITVRKRLKAVIANEGLRLGPN